MIKLLRNPILTFTLLNLLVVLGVYAYSEEPVAANTDTPSVAATKPLNDVIARVGDEPITYSELNTLLNSSAIVGLSVPALGTPERNRVRITLLDKAVSRNLLYLDAVKQGMDKNPAYLEELEHYADSLIAALYRQKYLVGDIEVSAVEVEEFHRKSVAPGTELTDDVRQGIEAAIRKQRFKGRTATMQLRLREGLEVVIHKENLDPAGDAEREDSVIVARIDDEAVYWKAVKGLLRGESQRAAMAEFHLDENSERYDALNRHIDTRIMAIKGKAAGLDQDPVFRRRIQEFRKTRLTTMHRNNLMAAFEPSEEDLWDYFEQHRKNITVHESRKLHMIVLNTKEEAEQLRQRILAGEITIYEAARDYSIDPNARQTLGDMGWVTKGTGFPELDRVTFSLNAEELSTPVESPAGWHLVTVQDLRDAQFEDIADEATRRTVRRRYLQEKMNEYVIKLRNTEFPVIVYEDQLGRLFREEAEWIAALEKKTQESPGDTQRRIEEIRQFMKH